MATNSAFSQASMSTQTACGEVAPTNRPKTTFLTLPTDIRLEIYDWVFYSTTLYTKETDKFDIVPLPIPEDINPEDTYPCSASTEVDIYRRPAMTEQLNLVCRLLNNEIGQSWHSKVEYSFYCSVAFLDVLGQWPEWKISTIRYAHIEGYPIPIYPVDLLDCYCTHLVPGILPVFPALRLDTLTVENIWLHEDGSEFEGWCLGATFAEVNQLLVSGGWKKLRYLSGTLGFLSRHVQEIEQAVAAVKEKRGEEGFNYALSATRPRLCGIQHHDNQGNITDRDTDEDKAEVAQWKAAHPKPREKPTEKRIQMWASRGTDNYEPKVEDRTEYVKGLMERLSWIELRKAGKYLVEDGTDDPCAHL